MTEIREASAPSYVKSTMPLAISSTVYSTTGSPPQTKRFGWVKGVGVGIRRDIRARAPYYVSDWTDAWNYRVIPATALIFFANYVPAVFSLYVLTDMIQIIVYSLGSHSL
jgi:hypothetical protein